MNRTIRGNGQERVAVDKRKGKRKMEDAAVRERCVHGETEQREGEMGTESVNDWKGNGKEIGEEGGRDRERERERERERGGGERDGGRAWKRCMCQ